MPNEKLLRAIRQAFEDHGKPIPKEDPEWALLIHAQVLTMEILESMMSTLQNLADNAKAEAAALVDLNTTVTALPPINTGTGGGVPGTTTLTPADQSLLDTANDTITSNIAKIGEIKTALGQPAVIGTGGSVPGGTTSAPNPSGASVSPSQIPPATPIIPAGSTPTPGGPPQS